MHENSFSHCKTPIYAPKEHHMEGHKRSKAAGFKLSQAASGIWAKQHLKINHFSDQSTVSHIFRDSDKITKKTISLNLIIILTPILAAPRLEYTFYPWICSQSKCGVMINAALVRKRAQQLLKEKNKHRDESKRIKISFSE